MAIRPECLSASEHDGRARQQHDGPGAAQSQFLPAEPVLAASGAPECEQRGMGQPAAQAGGPQVLSIAVVVIFLIFVCMF